MVLLFLCHVYQCTKVHWYAQGISDYGKGRLEWAPA
jgi:hypothetical protein